MRNCKDYLDYVRSIDRDEIAQYAGCAKARASSLISYLVERARSFSILDFAMFKVCLLSVGLLLGTVFSKFFSKFKMLILTGFLVSWAYMFWRIFRDDNWE